ncbi:MAG: hypothetical protein LH614_06310 [Pyrinomonadaceae bacterium]|nr:hypothetical protein [Pyrinomonadaceae bacterium]
MPQKTLCGDLKIAKARRTNLFGSASVTLFAANLFLFNHRRFGANGRRFYHQPIGHRRRRSAVNRREIFARRHSRTIADRKRRDRRDFFRDRRLLEFHSRLKRRSKMV